MTDYDPDIPYAIEDLIEEMVDAQIVLNHEVVSKFLIKQGMKVRHTNKPVAS